MNWEKDEPDVVDITEYQYSDYEAACKDQGMKMILTGEYEQDGNAVYTQYRHQDEEVGNKDNLTSVFRYNKGTFTMQESKDLDWVEGEEYVSTVITSVEETFNKREYTSSNGILYQLSDDNDTGVTRTTTMLSYDEYQVIISFTNLSEEEIQDILDSISIENK